MTNDDTTPVHGTPASIVRIRLDVDSDRPSTLLARDTPDGFVDCDGRMVTGLFAGDPRPATDAETALFIRCECESVTLLGQSDAPPSEALIAVRSGARVVIRSGRAPRRTETLTGLAPAASGSAPMPGELGRYAMRDSTPPISDIIALFPGARSASRYGSDRK